MKELKRPSRSQSDPLLPVLADIPATFTEAQAETIFALMNISAIDSELADHLLSAWSAERFSVAQARCIHEMLQLDADDLRATLADALEPCGLRRRLSSRRESGRR
ncbi:hypothetical protein QTH97_30780 [Variovorax sp. J22R24]|uniref:hypothetical protein n=1 Tax=Variovorax gracilis TaxID=3053502 RepID=UPI002575017E|nr:hypothetical protein [Variovorax sp. J22R24]MDM0109349.1 hypothetical protein [Variovorax sp. J22R24]